MFRWYENASVCYVYLADTSRAAGNIRGGIWFSRGWTMQELLAPAQVRFYDQTWTFLGSKTDLAEEISELTKIGMDCLADNKAVMRQSVATRMSWASDRQTTRQEDMAYCLLGVFQVNMPLIYGEGSRAFQRLQEEITRTNGDQSILAWGFQPEYQFFKTPGWTHRMTSGAFAPSPKAFQASGSILPTHTAATTPFALSHNELQVTLNLFTDNRSYSIGLVNCSDTRYQEYCIGILLDQHDPERTIRQARFGTSHEAVSTFLVPIAVALKAVPKTVYVSGPGHWGPPLLAHSVSHNLIHVVLDVQDRYLDCRIATKFLKGMEFDLLNSVLTISNLNEECAALLRISLHSVELSSEDSSFFIFLLYNGQELDLDFRLVEPRSIINQSKEYLSRNFNIVKSTLFHSDDTLPPLMKLPFTSGDESRFLCPTVVCESIKIANYEAFRLAVTITTIAAATH